MAVGRRWWLSGVFALGVIGLAGGQEREQERALLLLAQKLNQPPKKEPAKLPPAQVQPNGLPVGAVARLGHTRLRHAAKPTCVTFSPDGKSIITGGEDGTVRKWSVETGEQVAMLQKPGYGTYSVKVTHGGKRIAINVDDGFVRFLDAETLREIGSTPFPQRNRFAFTADGSLIATSDLAGNVVVSETATDLPKLELTGASQFDFKPDGKAIAVGDAKGTLTVHLVTGGKPVFRVKHEGAITGLAYSPNGLKLAVGIRAASGDDVIRVYEGTNEKPVAEITGMNVPKAWVATNLLACGNGTEAGVYSLTKKEWTGRMKGMSGDFAVSPDGTKLAATGGGLRVRLWDLTTGKQLHAENDSFPDPALLVGSADGSTLFMLTNDSAYTWPVGTGAAKPAGTLPGLAVAASEVGGKLLVATPDAVILYSNFDPKKPLPEKPTHTFKDSAGAKAVALSANGTRVAWAVDGGKVTVTDSAGKARREVPVDTTSVFALAFNPLGDRLGVLGRDPFLRTWDVSDNAEKPKEVWKARIQRGQKGAVAFSPDGKLVTAVSTAQLVVFDATDAKKGDDYREPIFRAERSSDNGVVQHATFSPDGRLLIVGTAGMYGRVEVWEVATRGLVRAFTTGYGGTARLCVFPDGSRAASAGAEEAITVWDLNFGSGKAEPKADDILTAINNLASQDAAIGYPAVKALVAAGPRGVGHLAKTLKEILANEKKIKEWIEDLGSETFSVRENALKELVAQGSRALPAIQLAVTSDDPEVRDRAREVMSKLSAKGFSLPTHGLADDSLRLFRAVQALEEIGGKDAKAVLEAIAATGGRPGEEAKGALARMKK